MKHFKNLFVTTLSVIATTCLVGCGGGSSEKKSDHEYDIKVVVGEDTKQFTENLIKEFNETNTQGIKFNADVQENSEKNEAGDVIAKPDSAPEIFCFAQDQISRLVESNLLAKPGQKMVERLRKAHEEDAVNAAIVGDTVYAYPLTADNGYFLYYDKRIITDDDAKSINSIVEKCKNNSKNFSFNLSGDGAGWYNASFFYGAGCKSEWTVNNNGKFTAKDDNYNSDNGLIAMRGIQLVVKSSIYSASDKCSDFSAAIPSAAVVSGIWDYDTAKTALGDNLGIAKLPTYEIDSKEYQLKSFLGFKLLGVTPQKDATKASALALLAEYLTNSDSQLKRYKAFGWGPSALEAQKDDSYKNDTTLKALKETATVPQGQYPAAWWSKAQVLGDSAKAAADSNDPKNPGATSALQDALVTYENSLVDLIG